MVVRFHYLFIAPLVVFSIPSKVTLGFSLAFTLVIIIAGLAGVFAGRQVLVTLASLMLVTSLIAGKAGTDLVGTSSSDTALFLFQFVAVIFFMEASKVVVLYENEANELQQRDDPMSQQFKHRSRTWLKTQLSGQVKLSAASLGISLILLVIGGFANVSVGQLAFSSIFVLIVVGALLFVITQRREPREGSHSN